MLTAKCFIGLALNKQKKKKSNSTNENQNNFINVVHTYTHR